MNQDRLVEFRCSNCDWTDAFDAHRGVERLRRWGKLRPRGVLDAAEVEELLLVFAPSLPCPQCAQTSLRASRLLLDDEAWPAAIVCQGCGRDIPAERLQVFPQTRLCVACQRDEDEGKPPATGEYCDRCGSPLVIRASRGSGIHRQELVCSAPGGCPSRRGTRF